MGKQTCGHPSSSITVGGMCRDCMKEDARRDKKDTPGGCLLMMVFAVLCFACVGACVGVTLGVAKMVWGFF